MQIASIIAPTTVFDAASQNYARAVDSLEGAINPAPNVRIHLPSIVSDARTSANAAIQLLTDHATGSDQSKSANIAASIASAREGVDALASIKFAIAGAMQAPGSSVGELLQLAQGHFKQADQALWTA
ncbi:MAG: hypothetical protein JWM90_2039 [Thermoleophilia bacterium]|nr:hypothetical protein [Thermoleophilia bacterium]